MVIRFSSIGDIVLCTPIIRCIKQQLGAEVHFLTKKKFSNVLRKNPFIDKLISYEDLDKQFSSLKSYEYDYVVDLHNNLRSSKVCKTLGREAFRLDKINISKWLRVNLGLDRLPNKHIVDRKFESIESIGVKYDGQGLDFYYDREEDLLAAVPKSKDRIGLVLGAAHYTKRIPHELINKIISGVDAEFFLLGGPAEAELGSRMAKGKHVHNWCGKTSLQGSAQLMESCDLIISSDTGLMHIAAALDKNIISIWGSTIPDFGMYPFMKDGGNSYFNIEVEDLHCRPCSKIGFEQCPKGHFACMQNHSIESILNRIDFCLKNI